MKLQQMLPSSVRAAIRNILHRRRLAGTPSMTSHGFLFLGHQDMMNGTFEEAEVATLRRIADEFDLLINIGANHGYYVCLARLLGKTVIAIEPHPFNVDIMIRNLLFNQWGDTEILPVAVGDQIGLVPIYGSDTAASLLEGWDGADKGNVMFVPCVTLDDVICTNVYNKNILLLIDVEGLELSVLRGGLNFIIEVKPIILLEICLDEHLPRTRDLDERYSATFKLLFDHDYTIRCIDDQSYEVTMEKVEKRLAGDKSAIPSHNFICKYHNTDEC